MWNKTAQTESAQTPPLREVLSHILLINCGENAPSFSIRYYFVVLVNQFNLPTKIDEESIIYRNVTKCENFVIYRYINGLR